MNKLQEHIKDYSDTLKDYISNMHFADIEQCKKCIRTVAKRCTWYVDCTKCPEYVHKKGNSSDFACASRRIAVKNSWQIGNSAHRRHLIAYHKGAVSFLKKMKRFNMRLFKAELLRLDRTI